MRGNERVCVREREAKICGEITEGGHLRQAESEIKAKKNKNKLEAYKKKKRLDLLRGRMCVCEVCMAQD